MRLLVMLSLLVLACDFSELTAQDSVEVERCRYLATHPEDPGASFDPELYERCLHGHAQPGDAGTDGGG